MKSTVAMILCGALIANLCVDGLHPSHSASHPLRYDSKPESVSLSFVGQLLPPNKRGRYDKTPSRVDAKCIQALLVCYADMKKAGIGSKSDIRNYEGVYFWQDTKYYYVIFISQRLAPKQIPGRMILDGEKIVGQDAKYLVRKSDFSIATRTFIAY